MLRLAAVLVGTFAATNPYKNKLLEVNKTLADLQFFLQEQAVIEESSRRRMQVAGPVQNQCLATSVLDLTTEVNNLKSRVDTAEQTATNAADTVNNFSCDCPDNSLQIQQLEARIAQLEAQDTMNQDLLAFYPLRNDALCEVVGCPTDGDANNGVYEDNAIKITGSNSVKFGNADAMRLRNRPWTIMFWLKKLSGDGCQFGAEGYGSGGSNKDLHFCQSISNTRMGFYGNDCDSTFTAPQNVWTHSVFQMQCNGNCDDIQNNAQRMFFNGVFQDECAGSNQHSQQGIPAFDGTHKVMFPISGYAGEFLIRNFRIYETALAEDKIAVIYNREENCIKNDRSTNCL